LGILVFSNQAKDSENMNIRLFPNKQLTYEQRYVIERYNEAEGAVKGIVNINIAPVGISPSKRWRAIALNHLEQAFMALERSVVEAEFI